MSTAAKTAPSSGSTSRKRREHPLFLTNPAITSAHQRIRLFPSNPTLPTPSPSTSTSIPSPPPFPPPPRPDTQTLNSAPTFSTSGSACLDLFFKATVRGCSAQLVRDLLAQAWMEQPELALQVLMHGRDCRGGKGERLVVTEALLWLRRHKPCTYLANLLGFLRVGYFKDLLVVAQRAWEEGQATLGSMGDEMVELEVLAEFLRHDAGQLSVAHQQKMAEEAAKGAEDGEEGKKGERKKGDEKAEGEGEKPQRKLGKKRMKHEEEKKKKQEKREKKREHAEKSEGKEEKEGGSQLSLAGKWAPTEGSHFDEKPLRFAHRIADLLFPGQPRPLKRYRQLLSCLRQQLQVVERLACERQWEQIQFERVPSKCHLLLKKAFMRHQEARYKQYLEDVKAGKKEVKSTGLQPHELTSKYRVGGAQDETTEVQWKALVRGVRNAGGLAGAIAVVDVSGSMTSGSGSVAPIDPAIALGLLVSEVSTGPFAHRVLTFSAKPQWHVIQRGSLHEQVTRLQKADWGGNTDLQATFDLILTLAVQHRVSPSALPSTLFILSDMEFDSACGAFNVSNFEVVQTKYALAGYPMPKVVFWNLSGSTGGAPVRMGDAGVALLSGFSGELLKVVMSGQIDNPHSLMVAAVSKYDVVVEKHET